MSSPDPQNDLSALDARIRALKDKGTPGKRHQEEHYSQAQQAWRMVIELVAGLGIGFGMGYGLDSLFCTLPVFLVIFTLLGFVAGVKTMLRSAAEMQKTNTADAADDTERAKDGD